MGAVTTASWECSITWISSCSTRISLQIAHFIPSVRPVVVQVESLPFIISSLWADLGVSEPFSTTVLQSIQYSSPVYPYSLQEASITLMIFVLERET